MPGLPVAHPLEYSPYLIEGESKHPSVFCSSNIAW